MYFTIHPSITTPPSNQSEHHFATGFGFQFEISIEYRIDSKRISKQVNRLAFLYVHGQVRARTGSGKTAAFALPLLQKILRRKEAEPGLSRGVRAVVLVPTRELCEQVMCCGEKDALLLNNIYVTVVSSDSARACSYVIESFGGEFALAGGGVFCGTPMMSRVYQKTPGVFFLLVALLVSYLRTSMYVRA